LCASERGGVRFLSFCASGCRPAISDEIAIAGLTSLGKSGAHRESNRSSARPEEPGAGWMFVFMPVVLSAGGWDRRRSLIYATITPERRAVRVTAYGDCRRSVDDERGVEHRAVKAAARELTWRCRLTIRGRCMLSRFPRTQLGRYRGCQFLHPNFALGILAAI
jgi:hypothetical protein